LPPQRAFREQLYAFLHSEASPVRYFHHRLMSAPLIVGGGEFGGTRELVYSAVQNNLARLALLAAAGMEEWMGVGELAKVYQQDASQIYANMERYMVDEEGCWLWCINVETLQPDTAFLNSDNLKGFAPINGVACMVSEVLGWLPLETHAALMQRSLRTFARQYASPARRHQFEKYGLWMGVDHPVLGLQSDPSYRGGYALQTMLLFDRLDLAEKLLDWLADATYHAEAWGATFKTFETGRISPYYFYERYFSPDAAGLMDTASGCGPLNLVCVAEPVKAARLILGVDDTLPDEVQLIPRLPPTWQGMAAVNWPVRTSRGVQRAAIRMERTAEGFRLHLEMQPGQSLPRLAVRLPAAQGYTWYRQENVVSLELVSQCG